MSEAYKLKEVHIQMQDGVTLIAEVSSVAAVRALLDELGGGDIKVIKHKATLKPPQYNNKEEGSDSPAARLESKAELTGGSLGAKKVLAFKDDVPELLKANTISITDAVLILLFAVETGLRKNKSSTNLLKGYTRLRILRVEAPWQ